MPQFSPSSTLPVSAEQAAAETYRQMFQSGNFFVEYRIFIDGISKENFSTITLAGKDGKRMQRKTSENRYGNYGDGYIDGTEISIIYAGFNLNERTKNLFTGANVNVMDVQKNQHYKNKN